MLNFWELRFCAEHSLHRQPHVPDQRLVDAETGFLHCLADVDGTAIEEIWEMPMRPLINAHHGVPRARFGHSNHDEAAGGTEGAAAFGQHLGDFRRVEQFQREADKDGVEAGVACE
jgi:hypothetical protein